MVTVRNLMSPAVVTIGPQATLREALALLARHRISGVPVVSQGRVLGVVSLTDLLGAASAAPAVGATAGQTTAADEAPAAYFGEAWADSGVEVLEQLRRHAGRRPDDLDRQAVSQVMSRPICWVPPDLPVKDAAAYMTRAGVHRVLVLEEGRLVGVLSAVDIVRALGEGEVV